MKIKFTRTMPFRITTDESECCIDVFKARIVFQISAERFNDVIPMSLGFPSLSDAQNAAAGGFDVLANEAIPIANAMIESGTAVAAR